MGETSLKFGPEWLRALTHGGASSPPSSPLPVGFRYGKDEMLALCSSDLLPPDDYDHLGLLFVEEMQLPLTFLPLNAEEQRMIARGINSDAVLRGTGRPPTNGVGRGRGGSVDRGRGRGRGSIVPPYYSRGISYDEDPEGRGHIRDAGPPGLNGRGKIYDRSQSVNEPRGWNERGVPERVVPERGLNPSLEDSGVGIVSPRKEPNRANNQNWRSRGVIETGDRWSGLNSNRNEKWGPRPTWRERENGQDGEWEEMKGHPNSGGYSRGPQRPPWVAEREKELARRKWEDYNLPEWATESTDDKGGSFDATGAFHAPGYSDDESTDIFTDCNTGSPPPMSQLKEENKPPTQAKKKNILSELEDNMEREGHKKSMENYHKDVALEDCQTIKNYSLLANGNLSEREHSDFMRYHKPDGFRENMRTRREKEVEDFDHMQIVADDLVAKLVDDDPNLANNNIKLQQSSIPPPAGFNRSNQLAPEEQWFYTDPQGEIQGPFSSEDMAAWYDVGYFQANLLLRRQCDDKFAKLGDLMKAFGRMPFLAGPAVPPLKLSELFVQKALVQREQEELHAYQVKLQIHQQQTVIRQHQVLKQLQSLDDWHKLTSAQQQLLFMEHVMSMAELPSPPVPSVMQDQVPPTTTTASMMIPSGGGGLLAKNARSSIGVSPVSGHSQDPIQVLMAQMQSQPTNAPVSCVGNSSLEAPIQISATPPTEGPLQKLLTQLRGPLPPQPNSQAHPMAKAHLSQQTAEPADPIKVFLNSYSKMPPTSMESPQEEHRRREDQRLEAEREMYEEQQRLKEERIMQAERLYFEKLEEERLKMQELEEEKLLLEQKRLFRQEQELLFQEELEENRKQEELEKRMQQKRKAEEAKLLEEENRKLQKIRKKQEEDARRKEELKKKEETERQEAKRKEEERICEEKKKKDEKKQEEERKRKEKQAQNQEQMRKTALEEERKRMNKAEAVTKKGSDDQKRTKNSKQTQAAWNSKTVQESAATPSLAEIQKSQEIREKKDKEAEMKDLERRSRDATQKANEEKRKKELSQSWSVKAGAIQPSNKKSHSSQPPVKSLVEIQQEEEKELKKRLKKEQTERTVTVNHTSLNAAGVWGSAPQSLTWASRASVSGAAAGPVSQHPPPKSGSGGSSGWAAVAQPTGNGGAHATINGGDDSNGFWYKGGSRPTAPILPNSSAIPSKNLASTSLKLNVAVNNKLAKKKNKDENVVKKIFTNSLKCDDDFSMWCTSALTTMKISAPIDIPTFVGFLMDVDSPYDVHDYIRSYLGDKKEVKTFAKDYLERRSMARNANKHDRNDDDILAPAPAVNPTNNQEFQEIKPKSRKGKKKMQKVDNDLLGFKPLVNEQQSDEN